MIQKALVILLLIFVEFSTIKEYCYDTKVQIEISDDAMENYPIEEDDEVSKDVLFDIFLPFINNFTFQSELFSIKSHVIDTMLSTIPQPYFQIYSPPPQLIG